MKRAICSTLFVVCCALPALAADLEFSADGEVEYDNNVFRSDTHTENDVLFRVRPGVRIFEDRGDDVNFSVGYEAPVEFSLNNSSDLNDVDHVGVGEVSYHPNQRFELFARERYAYIRSTLRETAEDPIVFAEGSPQFNDQRDRVKVNDASIGSVYHFSPRMTGRAIVDTSFFDSTRDDRARVWSVGGQADAQYRLTLRHQIGAGAGYTYQDFGNRLDIEGSQTNIYRLFGTWRWTISETLSFDANAGPAYLDTHQDDASAVRFVAPVPFVQLEDGTVVVSNIASCGTIDGQQVASECAFNVTVIDPTLANQIRNAAAIPVTNFNAQGKSDSEVTGFAELVLTQRWTPTLSSALRYSRQQGDASGLGGTVIVDAVSLSNTWNFADRWQIALRGDYVRRESASDVAQSFDVVTGGPIPGGTIATRTGVAFNSTQDVEIDTNRWGVAARITHQLFKRTSLYAQVRYDQQDSKQNSLGSTSDFKNFLATFGVRHVFEPIPLW